MVGGYCWQQSTIVFGRANGRRRRAGRQRWLARCARGPYREVLAWLECLSEWRVRCGSDSRAGAVRRSERQTVVAESCSQIQSIQIG